MKILATMVFGVCLFGFGYLSTWAINDHFKLYKENNRPSAISINRAAPTPTLIPIKIPSVTAKIERVATIPKIDCVGPDGVHFKTTQKECDDFNNAWNKPKPTLVVQKNTIATSSYTSPNYPPCTIYYAALGYSQTYNYISPEDCQKSKDAVSTPLAEPINTTYTAPQSSPVYVYWHPNPQNPTPGYGFHN